jgi:hypothetical protein
MRKLVLTVGILILSVPGVAFAQPKTLTKPTPQTAENNTYLEILNRALTQGAPDYLSLSDRDKLEYGHYTCQALESKVSLDTIFFDYMRSVIKNVPAQQQHQAGFLLGSSMYAGVYSFCPQYMPQLNEWGKKRFIGQ